MEAVYHKLLAVRKPDLDMGSHHRDVIAERGCKGRMTSRGLQAGCSVQQGNMRIERKTLTNHLLK